MLFACPASQPPEDAGMTAFVLQQTDYIYFVYGLSFLLLGSVCFYLSRSNAAFASWQWLGAFGMFHGIKEWLDLAAMCLGDDPNRQWLRLAVLTLSFLCLCEFARRTTSASRLRSTGDGSTCCC